MGAASAFAQENPSPYGVSSTYIERFNQAAQLAREGRSEEAFRAYDAIFGTLENPREKEEISWNFFVEVNLRKAYCLMDLNRYQDAWVILEGSEIKPYLSQIHPFQRHAYFFSLGNILGNLGKVYLMRDKFIKAIKIAGQELNDPKKEMDSWFWLLQWGKTWQKWDFLYEVAYQGLKRGFGSQNEELVDMAEQYLAYSYRGKGHLEKGLVRPLKILQYYKNSNNSEKVKEWEYFISSFSDY